MQDEGRMRTRNWIVGVVVVAVLAVILVIALKYRGDEKVDALPENLVETAPTGQAEPPAETPPSHPDEGPASPAEEARREWEARLGFEPEWPVDLDAPQDCERVEQELQRLCVYLDARPELRELADGYGSCDLLRQAAETLSSRPPRVSSELRSYEVMLANVFHLSRVLGRKALRYPARVLDRQQELAEPLALAVYRWAISREQCQQTTPLDGDVLYAYAGFLFNTMGGQAYLRRRTPRVEGLACFYALQVVDSAQQRGYNPDGLDPRKEIARCSSLLEGQPLVFEAEYLANLEDMALRWESAAR